jgi:tetratricopeptide (TPR) repeat protein
MKFFTLILLLAISSGTALADEFPFTPPKNFIWQPQYTAVHHPVYTDNLMAQRYFDQGLTFLYAFNHDAAYWSFLRAAEVDPKMAMAYWGQALVLGSNINIQITPKRADIAYEAIQKALQLSDKYPESEREYILALSKRYDRNEKDSKKLAEAYSQAMKKLVDKYPDDVDAAVLYAESLLDLNPWNQWSKDGKPLPGTMEAVDTLENVLKKEPNHLGANHYFVHVIEASPYPERGLMSAHRLKTLLPSSGHLLHMPSHIYLQVGDFHQSVMANLKAVAADYEYIRQYGKGGIYPIHYLSHNLFFLCRSYAMEGNFEGAMKAAIELNELYLPHYRRMPELESYAYQPIFVLLRFNRWRDILNLPKPSSEMRTTNLLWHFARAMALIQLGDFQLAEKEKTVFLEGKRKMAPEINYGYNLASKILTIAEYSLEARLAEAQGRNEDAINNLQQAIDEQETLRYNEPPDWYVFMDESLGGLLLRMQRPNEAERIFRMELAAHPRNGRALFGLKESLLAQSKAYDYYWVNRQFQEAWRYSDTPLTIKNF